MVTRLLVLLLLASTPAAAQTYVSHGQLRTNDVQGIIRVVTTAPSGACTPTTIPTFRAFNNGGAFAFYYCDSGTSLWTLATFSLSGNQIVTDSSALWLEANGDICVDPDLEAGAYPGACYGVPSSYSGSVAFQIDSPNASGRSPVVVGATTTGHIAAFNSLGNLADGGTAGVGDALVANPLSQFAATTSAQLATVLSNETGSGSAVFATSPTLVAPVLGTVGAGSVLTNATGLPIATGVSGLGAGVATFLATPSTANIAAAVTGETGTGALVFATSPTLVTPALGTPSAAVLTSATGLPISTGVSGMGTGVATALATPSSANMLAAVTDETGTGALVFATSPVLVTPALGTPSSGTLTNATGLPPSGTTFASTDRLHGRDTSGGGAGEEVTISAALDMIGSCSNGHNPLRVGGVWTCVDPAARDTSANKVTVCATGCDYATVQAALTATAGTGTATAPITIQIQPGRYSECVDVTHANDYTTLVGSGSRDDSEIYCNTASESTLFLTSTASATLSQFAVENLKFTNANATLPYVVNFDEGTNDSRFELTIRGCALWGTALSSVVVFRGTSVAIPTGDPSTVEIRDSYVNDGTGLNFGNHTSLLSYSNEIHAGMQTGMAASEAKCFGDHGMSAVYEGTRFISVGDNCEAKSGPPSSNIDSPGAVAIYGGAATNFVSGMRARVTSVGGAGTLGTNCFSIGAAGAAAGTLEVVGSTCDYFTTTASQNLGGGASVYGDGRLILRNVRLRGSGPGTNNDIFIASDTTPLAYIRYDGLIFDTTSVAGSGLLQPLNPPVIRNVLRAGTSVALPATGATLDANNEFRQFDATADENASWRTERVSDLYDASSLYTPSFKLYWRPVSGPGATVVSWRVGICVATTDDPWPCTVSSFSSASGSANVSAGNDLVITSGTLPTGILSAGKALVVTVQRDGDGSVATDDYAADAELGLLEISYGVK